MKTKTLTFAAMGAVMIAMCAWIRIPAAVPFTMQTFAVFLILHTLGGKQGSLAIAVYLLLGVVGVPVFAGFNGGPGALLGSTGGYILGFLLCGLVYWVAECLPILGRFRLIVADIVGLALCYAFGSVWFLYVSARGGTIYDLSAVVSMCVLPFLIPDLLKLTLALVVGKRLAAALKTTQIFP